MPMMIIRLTMQFERNNLLLRIFISQMEAEFP